MIFINEDQVRQLLPMPVAIECLRQAFQAYGRGEAQNHPRRRLILPAGAVLHSMAAAYGAYFGTKIYSTHVRHGAHFTMLLYDAATARLLAQFEANYLGQIRTGAASGLAADLLAPAGPLTVAVIGSGFQARSQLEAIRSVRPVKQARVWSRSPEKRERFASETGAVASLSAVDACNGADIIVCATFAKEPVLPAEAVGSDALILAVGVNIADRREVPAAIVTKARIMVDDIEQCRHEAGDLILAGIDWNTVEPLSAIANREAGGSRRLTVFKSVGVALEDVAVAGYVYERIIPVPSSADPNRATR